MTSPAKFRKDKEIVAEYDTQVKGNAFVYFPKSKQRRVTGGKGMRPEKCCNCSELPRLAMLVWVPSPQA